MYLLIIFLSLIGFCLAGLFGKYINLRIASMYQYGFIITFQLFLFKILFKLVVFKQINYPSMDMEEIFFYTFFLAVTCLMLVDYFILSKIPMFPNSRVLLIICFLVIVSPFIISATDFCLDNYYSLSKAVEINGIVKDLEEVIKTIENLKNDALAEMLENQDESKRAEISENVKSYEEELKYFRSIIEGALKKKKSLLRNLFDTTKLNPYKNRFRNMYLAIAIFLFILFNIIIVLGLR